MAEKIDRSVASNTTGYIYVASNPIIGTANTIKIGISKDYPTRRMKELSTTGVPESYVLEYCAKANNYQALEQEVHEHFDNERINPNREFFETPTSTAIDVIRQLGTPFIEESVFHQTEEEIKKARDARKIAEAKDKLLPKLEALNTKILDSLDNKSITKAEETIRSTPQIVIARNLAYAGGSLLAVVAIAVILFGRYIFNPNSSGMGILAYLVLVCAVVALYRRHSKLEGNAIQSLNDKKASIQNDVTKLLAAEYKHLKNDPEWETKFLKTELKAQKLVEEARFLKD